MRRPHPGRGYELRIGAVLDGPRIDTVWSAGKDRFDAESIERCALTRVSDRWRLYVSFVRHDDRRWRFGLIEAGAVDAFDPTDMTVVLDPQDLGQVDAVTQQIARDIRNQYTIGYKKSPNAASGYRSIKVQARARGYKDLQVRTRSGYFPGQEQAEK